jgi:hypothetical protein
MNLINYYIYYKQFHSTLGSMNYQRLAQQDLFVISWIQEYT